MHFCTACPLPDVLNNDATNVPVSISELLKAYNVAIDHFTTAMLVWNFGVIGMICIHWKGPLLVQQTYMIVISALVSLMFIKHLPDWTTWAVLIIVALWGEYGVLLVTEDARTHINSSSEHVSQCV